MRFAAVFIALIVTGLSGAYAADPSTVPPAKHTKLEKYLSAKEAADFVAKDPAKTLFLDIRTPSEVAFLGMPTMADANVPYMVEPEFATWDATRSTLKLEGNPDFLPEVRKRLSAKGLGQNDRIVLMCRSGDRSAAAANLLAEAGLTNVYSVVDGFEGDLATDGPHAGQRAVNGWKNSGLPWTYKLDKDKMYKMEN
jgi:rhodanese-related sulfurtransferase